MAAEFEVRVPDIGDFKNVPVIEVLVKPGDAVGIDTPLVVLETDKATMEVPSPSTGVVRSLAVKVGDRLNQGDAILTVTVAEDAAGIGPASGALTLEPAAKESERIESPIVVPPVASQPQTVPQVQREVLPAAERAAPADGGKAPATLPPASPMVRKLARELGVDLVQVQGSAPRGRIVREDVERFVREQLSRPTVPQTGSAGVGALSGMLPWPKVDFAKYGAIERQPLARLRKISGANLSRNWVMIPHVTNFDEADITELEVFRQQLNKEQKSDAPKLTLLCFLIKACVEVLRRFPEYNASLDGEELVLKRYFHIGFAADTPNGLVVPVIRDADRKGLREIAAEAADLAALARNGKLKPDQMQGGCFSVSSLGGIGGTGFTPIINAPEVAILGVTKAELKPRWDGNQFQPRLMVPLNLSWDHRVVDGASAARFLVALCTLLSDFRRVCL